MPSSVRVKRDKYSTISESSARPDPRSLFTTFRTPGNTSNDQGTDGQPNSPPGERSQEHNRSTLPARRRQRQGSIVQRHCRQSRSLAPLINQDQASGSSRLSVFRQSYPDHSTQSDRHSEFVTFEGEQANVLVHGTPGAGPGRLDSALSLDRPSEEGASGVDENGAHHHDDIVEHLDCIDPQVGTVADLTNAANAIMFPPLPYYSRKPVVVLPSRAQDSEAPMSPDSPYEDSLDRHVEDVLKCPSKLRRTLMGVWSFLKTPMGIVVGIYGFLVVFWGAALVFFLAKIINLHNPNTQGFWVEVCSQIMNGLFTVTGIGLIPFRVLDTYRIVKIWRYKLRVTRLRTKAGLPPLFDRDDLPDKEYDPNFVHVLTEKQELDLHRQQVKFHHSQTWYRPHGTETHRAFPINTALVICLLNDGNSFFQILLCATMWGLNRFERPAWTTGILIPASFLCGIVSGILIWRGGRQTRRTQKVEELLRAALASENPNHDHAGVKGNAEPKVVASPKTDTDSRRARRDSQSSVHVMPGQESENPSREVGEKRTLVP